MSSDSAGNEPREKIFGGRNAEIGCSEWQTTEGSHIIAGQIDAMNGTNLDVWLIKAVVETERLGNKEWENMCGKDQFDCGRNVERDRDGVYIITQDTSRKKLRRLNRRSGKRSNQEWQD